MTCIIHVSTHSPCLTELNCQVNSFKLSSYNAPLRLNEVLLFRKLFIMLKIKLKRIVVFWIFRLYKEVPFVKDLHHDHEHKSKKHNKDKEKDKKKKKKDKKKKKKKKRADSISSIEEEEQEPTSIWCGLYFIYFLNPGHFAFPSEFGISLKNNFI